MLFHFFFLLFLESLLLLLESFDSEVVVISEHDQFLDPLLLVFDHLSFQFLVLLIHGLSVLSALCSLQVVFVFVFELSAGLKLEPEIVEFVYFFLCAVLVSHIRHRLNCGPIGIGFEESLELPIEILLVSEELLRHVIVELQSGVVYLSLSVVSQSIVRIQNLLKLPCAKCACRLRFAYPSFLCRDER